LTSMTATIFRRGGKLVALVLGLLRYSLRR
jgi:hypothetical protein